MVNNTSANAKYVCNAVYISTGISGTTPANFTQVPLFLNGTNSYTMDASYNVQQIAFINQSGTLPYALSSINQYYAAL